MSLPSDLTGFKVACEKCSKVVAYEDASLIAVRKPPEPRPPGENLPLSALVLNAEDILNWDEDGYQAKKEAEILARTDGDGWMVACCDCSTEWVYWIDLGDLFDGGSCISWIEHLSAKQWFWPASFIAAVRRLATQLYTQKASEGPVRTKPVEPKRKREGLSVSVRFTVLQRDRFRCVYCGAAGVELHVDHRVSVADGGTDDLANLATACVPCNLGKGRRSVRRDQ
jgi:hypothetical protein